MAEPKENPFAGMSAEHIEALKALKASGWTQEDTDYFSSPQGMLSLGGAGQVNPAGYGHAAPVYAKQNLDMATGVTTYTDPFTGEVLGTKDDFNGELPVVRGAGFVAHNPGMDSPELRAQYLAGLNASSNGMLSGNPGDYTFLGDSAEYGPKALGEPVSYALGDPVYEEYQPPAGEAPPANELAQLAEIWSTPEGRNQFTTYLVGQHIKGNLDEGQTEALFGTLEPGQNLGLDPNLRNTVKNLKNIQDSTNALAGTQDANVDNWEQDYLDPWLKDLRGMERSDPQAFEMWAQNNPEWATRYYASLATGRYFVEDEDVNPKEYADKAQASSYMQSQQAGWGEDGMQDGKVYAYGYGGPNRDVNNEGAAGDFFKLGTPSAVDDNFSSWLEDNPGKVAALVGSLFLPGATPAVAAALGVSEVVAASMLAAAVAGVGGGGPTEVVLAAAAPFALAGLENWVEAGSQASAASEAANVGNSFAAASPGVVSETPGMLSSPDVLDVWNTAKGYDPNPEVDFKPVESGSGYNIYNTETPPTGLPKEEEEGGGGGEPEPAGSEATGGNEEDTTGAGNQAPETVYEPGPEPPPAGVQVDPNHAERDDAVWTHTNPDGTVVAGNDMGEVWEVDAGDDIEDPNIPWWAQSTGELSLGGAPGFGSGFPQTTPGQGTGGNNGNTGTGGSGQGGTGSGNGTGNGDGSGDGQGDGQGDGPGLGSLATGLLAGSSKSDYDDFMARLKVEFPLLEKMNLTPNELLQLITASIK